MGRLHVADHSEARDRTTSPISLVSLDQPVAGEMAVAGVSTGALQLSGAQVLGRDERLSASPSMQWEASTSEAALPIGLRIPWAL